MPDPVKKFALRRWHKINARCVNGQKPSKYQSYSIGLGRRVEFTREEFNLWCERQRAMILSIIAGGDIPSIDRVDDAGHYTLQNMRVIILHENIELGIAKRNKLRDARLRKEHPPKHCVVCGILFWRNRRTNRTNQLEPYVEYVRRKHCSLKCNANGRERNSEGDFVAKQHRGNDEGSDHTD